MLHTESSNNLLAIQLNGLKDQTFAAQRYNFASTTLSDRNCYKRHLTDTSVRGESAV